MPEVTRQSTYDLPNGVPVINELEVREMSAKFGDVKYSARATRHFVAAGDEPLRPASSWEYELKFTVPDAATYRGAVLVGDDGKSNPLTFYKLGQRDRTVKYDVVKPYVDGIMAYLLSRSGQIMLLWSSINNHQDEQAALRAQADYLDTIVNRFAAELAAMGVPQESAKE